MSKLAAGISKRIREAKGWSQQRLADELHVTRNYVALIEGEKKQPSVRLLNQLEQLLTRVEKGSTSVNETPAAYHNLGRKSASEIGHPRTHSREVMLDPRFQPRAAPSSRADVEQYFAAYLDAAAATNDPDIFPTIMRTLKRHLPLAELSQPPETPP